MAARKATIVTADTATVTTRFVNSTSGWNESRRDEVALEALWPIGAAKSGSGQSDRASRKDQQRVTDDRDEGQLSHGLWASERDDGPVAD